MKLKAAEDCSKVMNKQSSPSWNHVAALNSKFLMAELTTRRDFKPGPQGLSPDSPLQKHSFTCSLVSCLFLWPGSAEAFPSQLAWISSYAQSHVCIKY